MNILFYKWDNNSEQFIVNTLKKLGHRVTECDRKCQDYNMDVALIQSLFDIVHKENIEAIFSINFFPTIAEAAEVAKVKYISWMFDCPALPLYSQASKYECNRMFTFDADECLRLGNLGRSNVYHLPLAADEAFFQSVIGRDNASGRYDYDVSFVGSLYSDNEYGRFTKDCDKSDARMKYLMGFCEGLMNAQHQIYGANIIDEVLTPDLAKELLVSMKQNVPERYDMDEKFLVGYLLERKLSSNERKEYITSIAKYLKDKHNTKLTLFSNSNLDNDNIDCKGYVSYTEKMPVIFNRSKINMNFTVRNIHSGVSLRVFDVLACGGFLMMPYQIEAAQLFEDGREIVMFTDMDDMLYKIDYYLAHDDEREAIAKAGYEKVRGCYGYEHALSRIMECL